MQNPLALLIAILSLAISSGTMIYSVIETRSEIRLDPELERLAIGFFQAEEAKRAYIQKVDSANRQAEQNLAIPTDLKPADLNFGPSSINFGAKPPQHK